MIRRLVEADFFQNRQDANAGRIRFWLRELRTPQLLVETADENPATAKKLAAKRPLLRFALRGELKKIESALLAEEMAERGKDRRYWLPLRRELERLRHGG